MLGLIGGYELIRGLALLAVGWATVLAAANVCAAGLSLVEGIGLLMGQRWAIWLTLLVTGALLPLQVYELADTSGGAGCSFSR